MSKEHSRAWRARRKAAGLPIHSAERLAKQAAWNAESYRAARDGLFALLGRICVGCGHDDSRVLEFDHVRDDGAEDRRRFKGARSMLVYYMANTAEALDRLQVLCRNCNWLKRKGHALPNHEKEQLK